MHLKIDTTDRPQKLSASKNEKQIHHYAILFNFSSLFALPDVLNTNKIESKN